MNWITILGLALSLSGCATGKKGPSVVNYALFSMHNLPSIGTTLSGQEMKLGGFSGLHFLEEKEGALYFKVITDRGPNGPDINNDRPFLLPDFSPLLVTLKADKQSGVLSEEKRLPLKKKNGTPLTGLSNTRAEENPLDVFGLVYSIDSEGLDIEGLVEDGEGGWWMAEEYAPSLVLFDAQGRLVRRLTPDHELPRQYRGRRTNRGFEAIASNGKKIYGFMQSPLSPEQSHAMIVEVDTENSKTSAEYLYPFEPGNSKIGDAVHLEHNKFLVIEQNGQTGEKAQKSVHLIELGDSDRPVKKELVVDLVHSPFKDMEKIEGLALINKKKIALTYDNDFQVAGKTNFATGLTPLNDKVNQVLIIEFASELGL